MLIKMSNYKIIQRVFCFSFVILFLFSQNTYSQSTGKIVGKVTESTSGTPLAYANVVILNTMLGASTDLQGNFTISGIAPGNYKVKASFLGYQEEVSDITVQSGQTTTINFSLKETTERLQDVVVYGQLTRGQAKALNEQKNAPNIKNIVSSDQFLLFPDRNAAETVARIPGISITYERGEGEFVQIRGLAPQYNSFTLNGQRIPAPDGGSGRAVGLDLLNQKLMENIVVTKTLTPDMDGDAIGGSINFQLMQAPERFNLSLNAGGGYNPQHSFYNYTGAKDIVDLSGYAGNRFFDNKLGILLAGSYFKTNRGSLLQELGFEDMAAGIISDQHTNDYDILRERTGININTDYKFNEFNRIYLNYSYNRYFNKEFRRVDEWIIDNGTETKTTSNRVEDQSLNNIMFGGNHNFNGIKLNYTANWIKAEESSPQNTHFRFARDFDFTNYTNEEIKKFAPNTKFEQPDTLTLNRIQVDNNLKEDEDISGLANIEIPYNLFDRNHSLKFGGKYWVKNAKQTKKRLQLTSFAEQHTINEGEWGFVNVYVNPNDTTYLGAKKFSFPSGVSENDYDATEGIISVYGMTTLNLTDKFSVLAGLRFENTNNKYKSLAVNSVNISESDESYSNFLPSVHFTYRLTDNMNLRLAYSSGLARPDYTSLIPYEFRDDEDKKISRGNPNLKSTTVNNIDLMFERYTSSLGLFSAGLFYKNMTDVIMSSTHKETLTFEGETQEYDVSMPINIDDNATIYGIEIALNQSLNILNVPILSYFSIYANYTYTHTELNYNGRELPLRLSPENIFNIALMYDNPEIGLSFVISNNFKDNMLIEVGEDKYQDVYFDSEYHLDLSIRQRIMRNFSIFLQLNNLTDQQSKEIFGDPSKDYSRLYQWEKYNRYGTLGISMNF